MYTFGPQKITVANCAMFSFFKLKMCATMILKSDVDLLCAYDVALVNVAQMQGCRHA